MAFPLAYPILEGLGAALGTAVGAATLNRNTPNVSWTLHDNPIGRDLHWAFDPNWEGGFMNTLLYAPSGPRVERMPDGTFVGYLSHNNPDGVHGSFIRPNNLPEAITIASPNVHRFVMNRSLTETPNSENTQGEVITSGQSVPATTEEAEEDVITEETPAPNDKKPEDKKPEDKSGRFKKVVDWIKKNPWKSIAIGGALASKPARNIVYPGIADLAVYTFGEPGSKMPFLVPYNVNDSADIWLHGTHGVVRNSKENKTETKQSSDQNTLKKDTIPAKSDKKDLEQPKQNQTGGYTLTFRKG